MKWLPEVAIALASLKAKGECIVDGELCVLDDLGRMAGVSSCAYRTVRVCVACSLVAIPSSTACPMFCSTVRSVMSEPLEQRKERLDKLMEQKRATVLKMGHIEAQGQ